MNKMKNNLREERVPVSREESYLKILDAAEKYQASIAFILEAKIIEAQKSQDWIRKHMQQSLIAPEEQFKLSMEIHEHIVELLEGLTKMEQSLGNNLKVILNRDDGGTDDAGLSGFVGGL
jgi:hypothetical protein